MSELDLTKVDYSSVFASDIEANGLLDTVTKIWCIVSQDMKSGVTYVFHDYPEFDNTTVVDPEDGKEYLIPKRAGSLIEGARFWYRIGQAGGRLVVHNCRAYDRPLIERFYPLCMIPNECWWDTYIQSKIQWFDREIPKGAKGQHGLQAYGCRFGVPKPEVQDWSYMDAWKLHRCIEDVKIQSKTYKYLQQERKVVLDKLGIDFTEALETEHRFRDNATKQELNGALVDKVHMETCVDELASIIEDLRQKIEPNLPKVTKAKTPKITRSELASLFNMSAKDTYTVVDGVQVVDKPYYKPSVKFTKTEIKKEYIGYNKSLNKTTPPFEKKKDLTDYIKDIYAETKTKDWDITKTEKEEVTLNSNTCSYFEVSPYDTGLISGPFTKVEFLDTTLSQGDVVKSYLISLGWRNADEWTFKKDKTGQTVRATETTLVSWPEKPLYGNPDNVITRLVKRGQPLVVSPKLTEDCFEELPEGLGKDIADYNTYGHRLRFLKNPDDDTKGLLNNIRPDGRITCGINNFNTSTGRS
jgi:hypothetical protein